MTKSSTLPDKVIDHVVSGIVAGKYRPAEKISQDRLAKELNMSHIPVREALERLHRLGWIERIPKRGAFFREFSDADLREITAIREMFETHAVRQIAPVIGEDQLAELRRLVEAMEHAFESGQAELYGRDDEAFHKLIVACTGNARMIEMYDSVISQFRCFLLMSVAKQMMEMQKVFPSSLRSGHRAIYEALRDRDAARAEQCIREHMNIAYKTTRSLRELSSL